VHSQLFYFNVIGAILMVPSGNCFWEHWACSNRITFLDPQLQNRISCAPLAIIFSFYIHGSWTLDKPYGIKLRWYWEHVWKCDGNTLVTRKKFKESLPSPPSILQKEKSWTIHECMLSLPIRCTKFLFQNCSSPFYAWDNTPSLRTAIPICSNFGL
jgi:hypothetical protein